MANGNTNWRQAIPAALAAFAGAAEPRRAQSIASQAIAQQRNQMQKQRDEEAQGRFKEQMSMQGQQLALQDRKTQILEAQEERNRKKVEADEWLFLHADDFVDKDIDEIDEKELLRQLAEKAKAQGIQISPSQVFDFADRWLPSPTGDKQYYFDPTSGKIKVREKIKRGKKTYWTKGDDIEGIPGEILVAAKNNPGMINSLADTIEQQGASKETVKFFRDWAKSEQVSVKGASEARLAETARLKKIEQVFDNQVEKLNMKYFGTATAPKANELPTGDLTIEDYQYDYQQLANKRDAVRARGRYKPPRVPPTVKKYQKRVLGRVVTNRMWGRMSPEQQQAAIQIAEADRQSKGKPSKKLPSKKGAAARSLRQGFGVPAPGLLKPTGQMTGPPMNLEMIKRMMNQGGNL